MTVEDEYTDWQMHYEDCPRCTQLEPCPKGKQLRDLDDARARSRANNERRR